MKKSNYEIKPFDLTKGMRHETGGGMDQGMIPRRLSELTYFRSGPLVTRNQLQSYLGVYWPRGDGASIDGSLVANASASGVCSDGRRVYGTTSIPRYISSIDSPYSRNDSVVCELVDATVPYWVTTDIPAPRAVAQVASFPPMTYASFGTGYDTDFLVTNFERDLTIPETTRLYAVDNNSAVQDPDVIARNNTTGLYSLERTKVAGGGYTTAFEASGNKFLLIRFGKKTSLFWRLRDTGGSNLSIPQCHDTLVIGANLYVIVYSSVGSTTITMYRYDLSTIPTGSSTSTPVTWNASSESTYTLSFGAAGTYDVSQIAISSQESPTELRLAINANRGGAGGGFVVYLRRDLATLAAVAAYVSSAADLDYGFALTCDENVILSERSDSSAEVSSVTLSGFSRASYNARTVYGYVVSAGALYEAKLFLLSASGIQGVVKGGAINETVRSSLIEIDNRLVSHISPSGLVCIGGNIYRVGEESPVSAGVKNITARFVCRAIDVPANLSEFGEISSGTYVAGRANNSISRWVSDRYVCLPIGSFEQADGLLDTVGAASPVAGMSSNERMAIVDVDSPHLTAIQERSGTTCFGHGWAIATDRRAVPSFGVERPVITAGAYSAVARSNDWTSGELVSYRAVLVQSLGGIESYAASATVSGIVNVADIAKDIVLTVNLNGQLPNGATIRIYRNRTADAAGDFYFIGEITTPIGNANSVSFTDTRIPINISSQRPLDPTSGGATLQGLHVAGMRDIINTSDRNYVVTWDAVYPCQELIGDDRLPAPMPDTAVAIPPSYGGGTYLSSVADQVIVGTRRAVLAIAGTPPNSMGQGGSLGIYALNEGDGVVAKPCQTPSGAMVPVGGDVLIVDGTRSVNEATGMINGAISSGNLEFSGRCAYSPYWKNAFFCNTGSSSNTDVVLVADVSRQRWTGWNESIPEVTGIAAPTDGAFAGWIIFDGPFSGSRPGGYVPTGAGVGQAVATIDTGWNSYGGRFIETNARRLLFDGWSSVATTVVAATVQTYYNLHEEGVDADEKLETFSNFTNQRDGAGYRFTASMRRIRASSMKHSIEIDANTSTVSLEVDTLAVETQPDMGKYTAANSEG